MEPFSILAGGFPRGEGELWGPLPRSLAASPLAGAPHFFLTASERAGNLAHAGAGTEAGALPGFGVLPHPHPRIYTESAPIGSLLPSACFAARGGTCGWPIGIRACWSRWLRACSWRLGWRDFGLRTFSENMQPRERKKFVTAPTLSKLILFNENNLF